MEKTSTCLVLFFCLIACSSNIIFTKAQTGLIDFTCKQTKDYNLCVSALNTDPRSVQAKEIRELAKYLVQRVSYLALQTSNHIDALRNDKRTDLKTKQILDDCIEKYNKIQGKWLVHTTAYLAMADYSKALDSIGPVPTNVEICEKNFQWVGHVPSPITSDSKAVDDLAKVTYDVVYYHFMHPQPPLKH